MYIAEHVCAWNQLKLVTIDPYVPRSCMVTKHLVAVRESATEIVLEGAKVIFSFSSNVGM